MQLRSLESGHSLPVAARDGAKTALVAGVLIAAPLAWPQAPSPNANPASSCNSAVAEQQLLARETVLLGRSHGLEHAQTRREQCGAARRGASSAPPRAPLAAPAQSLADDLAVRSTADALASGTLSAAAARTSGAAATTAKREGRWSAPFPIPVLGIASVLLHTGKVLYWTYDPATYHVPTSSNTGVSYLWDPATREGRLVTPPENIWCGAQTLLSTGEVFSAGGNLRYPDPSAPAGTTGWEGSLGTYTFDPVAETWTTQPAMARGRWYPTVTQLGDNRVVILSGYDETGTATIDNQVEIFTPAATRGGVGQISVLANANHEPYGLYPLQSLLPSGGVLSVGPEANWNFVLDPVAGSWTQIGATSNFRYLGNMVNYTDAEATPPRQVIMVGGGQATTAPAGNQWLDGFNPAGGWKAFPQWLKGRFNSNTVILADGTLLTVGGGQGPNQYDAPLYEAELYPVAPTTTGAKWQTVAAPSVPSAYHSSAILLPDGSVLLSQDDRDTTGPHSAQVYSPAYMFKGSRIAITSAPAEVSNGSSFTVTTNRTGAASALLVAPGATTHGNDMHQRAIKVPVKVAGTSVTVSVPASRSLVPPGYYMLFIGDVNAIPSVARFVRVS